MDTAGIALVERARQRDREAFAALIRLYERMALAIAYGVLGDSSAAGDAAQEAFFRAWERLADLRDSNQFGPWLCGIVRNMAIDALRRRKPTETLESAGPAMDPARWTTDPADEAGRRETNERLAQAINSLDEQSRMVVVMRYYDNRSSKEIAELLGMTPAAVDMRLSRARKQLRTLIEDESEPRRMTLKAG